MTKTDRVMAALAKIQDVRWVLSERGAEPELRVKLNEAECEIRDAIKSHVLVPVEPTDEMLDQGYDNSELYSSECGASFNCTKVYTAMIAPYVKGGTE